MTRKAATAADRALLAAFWSGRCAYCGSLLGRLWDVEHITPLARGGQDSLDNMCPSCPPCNNKKGLATAEEFRCGTVPARAARVVTLVAAFWKGDRVATGILSRFGLTEALMTSYLFKPTRLRGLLDE